jgi:hypothetical protein
MILGSSISMLLQGTSQSGQFSNMRSTISRNRTSSTRSERNRNQSSTPQDSAQHREQRARESITRAMFVRRARREGTIRTQGELGSNPIIIDPSERNSNAWDIDHHPPIPPVPILRHEEQETAEEEDDDEEMEDNENQVLFLEIKGVVKYQ